ncbi:SGNH/GDSL hydrolase family protein [Marmoricola sp. RAF53]|uniref:SGNH/GDSL hydrolase family protein n=1 Tax=Marmoricola sp. RAF53 TaxID=3233059 RepID=UPI003F99E05A
MLRSSRLLLSSCALAALAAPFAVGAPATADTAPTSAPSYSEYVALGDSWSADVVIADLDGLPDTTYAPTGCAQSHRNYPKLVAKALGVASFRDATCGSATTDDFSRPQTGLPTGETNPAQFDRLTPTTDLVTVGIGGNDAGFAGAAISCINLLPANTSAFDALALPVSLPLLGSSVPLGGCKQRFVKDGHDQLADRIAASEPKLVAALAEIHRRSPRARVLMLNYLDAIPEKGCYPLVPITNTDMAYLHDTFGRLNAMVARAAAAGGAELVDSFGDSTGHGVCTSPLTRYVEGLGIVSLNGLAVAVPAHPNSAGAASQYRSVMKVLTGTP